jgi:hypothetical protein
MKRGWALLVGAIGVASCAAAYLSLSGRFDSSLSIAPALHVWVPYAPTSADPLDYDALPHHVIFRSVFAGLVSQYKTGETVGVLAERWSMSDDHRTWRFKLRKGLRFENGEPISPELVVAAWMRLAFCLRQRHSHSDLFDNLRGRERIDSPGARVEGLRAEGDEVVVALSKAAPQLLNTISFGLYSIIDRSNFDSRTGAWISGRRPIASGGYRVSEWSANGVTLKLRSEFPSTLLHPRAFQRIRVAWEQRERNGADLVVGFSNDRATDSDFHFFGAVPSAIVFVHVLGWNDEASPFHDLGYRREFRGEFYRALREDGFKPTLSFMPLIVKGTSEFTISDKESGLPPRKSRTIRYRDLEMPNQAFDAYRVGLSRVLKEAGFTPEPVKLGQEEMTRVLDRRPGQELVDLAIRGTSILVENPVADIRFMFESREGIRLPDVDGRIREELQRRAPSVQVINELLWDQAAVWPLSHYALGMWARATVDTALLNAVLPPVDLEWVGSSH